MKALHGLWDTGFKSMEQGREQSLEDVMSRLVDSPCKARLCTKSWC